MENWLSKTLTALANRKAIFDQRQHHINADIVASHGNYRGFCYSARRHELHSGQPEIPGCKFTSVFLQVNMWKIISNMEVKESNWKLIFTGLFDWKTCSSKTLALRDFALPCGEVLASCHGELATAKIINQNALVHHMTCWANHMTSMAYTIKKT